MVILMEKSVQDCIIDAYPMNHSSLIISPVNDHDRRIPYRVVTLRLMYYLTTAREKLTQLDPHELGQHDIYHTLP